MYLVTKSISLELAKLVVLFICLSFWLLFIAPKAPLLSLSCVNQIPVLNWTEVMYGSYKPHGLCVHHTCHSDTIDTATVSY